MYAFGHGLSYVEFEYGPLTCKQKKDKIQVSFDLKNLGDMEADEVAQLYVKRLDSKIERAEKELEAFERVALKVLEPGKIEILVGSASNDIRQSIHTEI